MHLLIELRQGRYLKGVDLAEEAFMRKIQIFSAFHALPFRVELPEEGAGIVVGKEVFDRRTVKENEIAGGIIVDTNNSRVPSVILEREGNNVMVYGYHPGEPKLGEIAMFDYLSDQPGSLDLGYIGLKIAFLPY